MTEKVVDGAGGTSKNQAGGEGSNERKETVSYETHLKLLNQRKADQARSQEMAAKLAEFEAEKKAREEADLLAQNKYEELLAKKEEEKNEIANRLNSVTETIIKAEKLEAFQRSLGGELAHRDFEKMINLNSIVYDEAGTLDQESLNLEVARVRETYGDSILKKTNVPSMSGNAPQGARPRGVADLSKAERAELRRQLVTKK
jgi:hypothetical protein